MPFARPTLTALQALVASDITTELAGADALLRFSNLGVTGRAQAGLANLHYGYLDWIATQAVPFTCTDEFLEGWAALKGVQRNPATVATGLVSFAGTPGTPIPAGTRITRGDSVGYTTTAAAVMPAGGSVVVPVAADPDMTGLTGAIGNAPAGTVMTLAQSVPGVQSGGVASVDFTGGADIEQDDSMRSRMLAAFQQPPMGGDQNDYVTWALQAPGVTRAWCTRNGFGPGTIVLFVMLDVLRAAGGGFPVGGNGVAAGEPRGAPATGDQLAVANYLLPLQAAVGLVYVVSPVATSFDFQLTGLPVSARAAAVDAIAGVFRSTGQPGGTIPYGQLWSAVAAIAGGTYFTLAPTTDVVCATGHIPVVGNVTYPGG